MSAITLTLLGLFLFGLAAGSFINVVSFRYKPGHRLIFTHSVGGRSKCRSCQSTLRWYELIPLFSFLIQGFKCRHCEHAVSWQYPIIEFLTGLLTVGLPIFFIYFFQVNHLIGLTEGKTAFFVFIALWILATYILITVSIIDLRHQIIPDQSNLLLGLIGVFIFFIKLANKEVFRYSGSFTKNYIEILGASQNLWLNLGLALLVTLLFFGSIIFFSKGKGMGLGDLKLAIPMAFLLGWPDALLAFMFAFFFGAAFGLMMIFKKEKDLKDMVPFGPFMVLGLYTVVLYGEPILSWYFSLL